MAFFRDGAHGGPHTHIRPTVAKYRETASQDEGVQIKIATDRPKSKGFPKELLLTHDEALQLCADLANALRTKPRRATQV